MVDLDTFLPTLYVMAHTFCNTLPLVPQASLSPSEVLTRAGGAVDALTL